MHVFTQLCKGDGADTEGWVHMHTYNDAYTHCNQGVGPGKDVWDMYTGLNRSVLLYKGDGSYVRSQEDVNRHNDA